MKVFGYLKIKNVVMACFICVIVIVLLFSQFTLRNHKRDTVQVDLAYFLKKIKNQPLAVKRKSKLYVSVLPAAGYTLHTGFAVSTGANGAFFLDDPYSLKLSVVNINVTISKCKKEWTLKCWAVKRECNYHGANFCF